MCDFRRDLSGRYCGQASVQALPLGFVEVAEVTDLSRFRDLWVNTRFD
jgi:hypothetical protein